ncbi:hypothetical protein PF008_g13991 [Phytophthora fragariae]|uniref:DUF659 domain-containing protein n=1 Tax=Phytophthora fragariae TaxID=53985 RepID=A0A6G0RI98_9STRA|nr:hypothetical protein PF008_g13991 [Phytophthora fragariae]
MSDLASDDSSSQSSDPSDSQASLVPLAQSVEGVSATPIVDLKLDSPPPTDLPPSRTPEIPSASPSTAASSTLSPMAPRPASSVGVDAFGVPLAIRHHRQDRGRNDVWELAHQLDEPYPTAWEGALHRWKHTSNVKAHMVSTHGDHRLGKTEASKKLETAVRHLDGAISREAAFENKRAASAKVDDRVSKRKVTIQRLWVPSQREIGIFISQWLISAGMPHHTVATEEFKLLIQRLTGDSGATILAASTFRDLLLAVFAKFCKMTKGLLMREFKAVLGLPFLNLHHDGWTTANGRVGATGTLASFVDASWTFHEVALLLTVGHNSHASADVHKMICSRMKSVYEVDIDPIIQFTILDTTASARKVQAL